MDTLTSIPASFIKDFSSLHVADLTTDEHTLLVDYIALTRDIIEANQLFEVFYFNLLNLRNSFILHSDDEISSLLVILSRSGSFVLFSGRLVCAESRLKQGFFALEALLRLHFFKVGSNRHFCRFWREIGEDRREITREGNTKLHTPQKGLQTDEIYF